MACDVPWCRRSHRHARGFRPLGDNIAKVVVVGAGTKDAVPYLSIEGFGTLEGAKRIRTFAKWLLEVVPDKSEGGL